VVVFDRPSRLTKFGRNYFYGDGITPSPGPLVGTEVRQGQAEVSNVSAAESAVRLVNVLRQFEALQKILVLTGDMNRKVLDEVAKVTP
jgi:flagellar basal body rod protein FlgG